MRPLGHTPFRRLARWALALLLLPPLLLLGSVEALYRYGLSRVGELPRAPPPRTDFASQVLWASVEEGPLRLQPLWPWTLVDDFVQTWRHRQHGRRSAGSWMSGDVARRWLASRPRPERAPMLNWHLHGFALSVWISRHWTAEEVMAAYAESASFGRGHIGLDAAARSYFGKEPTRLALHETALLAGLTQAPARYDPLCRPEAALARREVVLSRLQALGWISEAQREEARQQPLLPPSSSAATTSGCE
ncbi:transglycosylase domain-containing protein [Archangium gephyra]|uniref:transglycosylase domain-containing protein n=1 Tax=Archangium gephyra TaxID=48 RepID=UPI0035D51E27